MTTAASNRAGLLISSLAAAAAVALGAYLVWGLRSLIVPAAVGGLLAYICRPLVAGLERRRIPRGVAIGLLLLVFVLGALVVVNAVRAAMPSDTALLGLRIRAVYMLNRRYETLMGLDRTLTRLVHGDLDPLVDRVNELLALTPDEHAQFIATRRHGADGAGGSDQLLEYDRANVKALEMRARRTVGAEPAAGASAAGTAVSSSRASPSPSIAPAPTAAGLGHVLSAWIVAPLIFLFLLRDNGEIKRGLLRLVPNRLFEPALTVLRDLDEALGDYVRGIFLECCLLGLTVALFLTIIGVPLRWTIAIGTFTGASNVVPYMGFAVALASGLAYGLLAEGIRPLLPMVNMENFALWVIVAVALAELFKNVIYEPVVLGGAVKLHPLVVVIGVIGGAILFGPVGMLLAIPTMTVVRVFVSSTARQLKAYSLI